jgi:hypothetical protein
LWLTEKPKISLKETLNYWRWRKPSGEGIERWRKKTYEHCGRKRLKETLCITRLKETIEHKEAWMKPCEGNPVSIRRWKETMTA